jgi:hypothetical protein
MTRVEELQEIVRRVADYRSADKHDPESYARRTVTKAQAEFNHKFVKADGNAGQVPANSESRVALIKALSAMLRQVSLRDQRGNGRSSSREH